MIELSKFQYKTLNDAANGDSRAFVVLQPSPKDSEEKRNNHLKDIEESEQLVTLGLVEDVSSRFKDSIQMAKLNSDREFKVYVISELGQKMFGECEKRLVN